MDSAQLPSYNPQNYNNIRGRFFSYHSDRIMELNTSGYDDVFSDIKLSIYNILQNNLNITPNLTEEDIQRMADKSERKMLRQYTKDNHITRQFNILLAPIASDKISYEKNTWLEKMNIEPSENAFDKYMSGKKIDEELMAQDIAMSYEKTVFNKILSFQAIQEIVDYNKYSTLLLKNYVEDFIDDERARLEEEQEDKNASNELDSLLAGDSTDEDKDQKKMDNYYALWKHTIYASMLVFESTNQVDLNQAIDLLNNMFSIHAVYHIAWKEKYLQNELYDGAFSGHEDFLWKKILLVGWLYSEDIVENHQALIDKYTTEDEDMFFFLQYLLGYYFNTSPEERRYDFADVKGQFESIVFNIANNGGAFNNDQNGVIE